MLLQHQPQRITTRFLPLICFTALLLLLGLIIVIAGAHLDVAGHLLTASTSLVKPAVMNPH